MVVSPKKLINFILFQSLWFCCVLGAAAGVVWPGLLCFSIFLFWQMLPQNRVASDIVLLLSALIMGMIMDGLWLAIGVLKYSTSMPSDVFAPIWILLLWAGLALTINHSLSWLKTNLLAAAVLSMLSSPLSYYAGYKLGALEFLLDFKLALLTLGLSWGILIPLLVILANRYAVDNSQAVYFKQWRKV